MNPAKKSYDELQSALDAEGVDGALDALTAQLRAEGRAHQLFDALSMQARHRLGLPLIMRQDLDAVAEPQRSQLEAASLDVCREVGELLLTQQEFREAWMYLRPTGDTSKIRQAMEVVERDDEITEELIDVGLNEGVHPGFGFQLVLDTYGTCNAITGFESSLYGKSNEDQQLVAGLLVEHVHRELFENLRADLEERDGSPPDGDRIAPVIADRDDLFGQFGCHIDVSHLQSTVRYARIIVASPQLELVYDLTQYGQRLHEELRQAGDEPFVDFYAHHGLFYGAQLGHDVDIALDHFAERAEQVDPRTEGVTAIEVYMALLARLDRHDEALQAAAKLVQPGMQFSGFAPSMFELAEACNRFDLFSQLCRDRDDLVGFATGIMAGAKS